VERPRCAAYLGMSLDGFIARPDGGLDWLEGYPPPPGEYQDFLASVDTLLVGRATYEQVLGFPEWPYAEKRVVVLTHRPAVPRHGEAFVAGEPAAVLGGLAAGGSRSVYLDGGAVVSQFLAADLLDRLVVTVVPIVLGAGRRLFQGALPERPLTLVASRAHLSGLVRLEYRAR